MKPGQCSGQTEQGNPCAAKARPGTSWCPWHDPDLSEQRSEWSAKGGQQRSNTNRAKKKISGDLRDMASVKAMLLDSMQKTLDGTLEPGILTALATAARAVVQVAGVADFEAEIIEMRAELAELTGKVSA